MMDMITSTSQIDVGCMIYSATTDTIGASLIGPFFVKRVERISNTAIQVDVVHYDGFASVRYVIPSRNFTLYRKEPISQKRVESKSKPGVSYTINTYRIGFGDQRKILYSCNCPAWRFHHVCTHIKEYQQGK